MTCLVDGAWFSRQSCLVPAVGDHSGGKFFLSLSVDAASPFSSAGGTADVASRSRFWSRLGFPSTLPGISDYIVVS